MLNVLHRIVQEVTDAPDLQSALAIIVQDVKQAIGADACSIYLTDMDTGEHVLAATDGLRREAVGKVRLPQSKGLIGLVCERAEPVNLPDAHQHPRYLFIPDTGEKAFRGFIGVPIIQNRRVLGVLVARQHEPRSFDDDEVTFLFTLAAQLAGAITHARASGELGALPGSSLPSRYLEGRPGSSGVGLGIAVVVYPAADLEAVPDRPTIDPVADEALFRAAILSAVDELKALTERMQSTLQAEDRALFDAWLMMLDSETLVDRTVELIHAGNWAPGALRQVIEEHAQVFDAMEDPYLRERGSDVRDLGTRILMHLENRVAQPLTYPEHSILVGEEVSAIQLAEVPRERLAGIISAKGSSSSHVAILARAIGVPAVMGVTDLPVGRMDGRDVIIDGYRGRVYVSPAPSICAEYEQVAAADRALSAELLSERSLPCCTADGVPVSLYLNTGLVLETNLAEIENVAGVGLYRTEFPFMVRDAFPGESVQTASYERVLAAFAPRPVTMRTLDVGGDKPLPYFPVEETNPFLGWRGIRISLAHPEIFLGQVRAMLRASSGHGNLRLLLPMISTVREVEEALLLIHQAFEEIREEGYRIQMPPLGVMVEVPAAVYQAEALASRVDFLSIGTNDLTQYLLAVDRNNPHVADLFDDMHPAVLRAVHQVVEAARVYDREVSVCGELAGSPCAVVLLLGMGITSLSMSLGSLSRVKRVIRQFTMPEARELVRMAMAYEDVAGVRSLLNAVLETKGLASLISPRRN